MAGMTETELLELCSDKNIQKGYAEWIYPSAEMYGYGNSIRDYGFYLKSLPLLIYTDHNPFTPQDVPCWNEITMDAPCMFYHSPRLADEWKKHSDRPSYNLYSPNVFYRRKNKIEKSPDAKGTIAFPAHTTPIIDDLSNMEEYIQKLKNLPDEFQPVSICLYYQDILRGKHKIFLEHNFPVYTAGYLEDQRFISRFYNILKNFKYATSNEVGSYIYYAVEMGIPFSIYGDPPKYFNESNICWPLGELDYNIYPEYTRIYNLFDGLNLEISHEQKEYIEINLGLRYGISRFKMAYILYKNYFKNKLNKLLAKFFKRIPFKLISMHPQMKGHLFENPLPDKGKRIFFYGSGSFALNLIRTYDLSGLNICGFIDRNSSKKGQKVGPYEIFSLDEIEDLKPDIIVLTVVRAFDEIIFKLNQIKKEKKINFEIIKNLKKLNFYRRIFSLIF